MNSTYRSSSMTWPLLLFPVVYAVFVVIVSIPANIGSLCVSFLAGKARKRTGHLPLQFILSDLLYASTLLCGSSYLGIETTGRSLLPCAKGSAFSCTWTFTAAQSTCIMTDRCLAVVYPLRFFFLRSRNAHRGQPHHLDFGKPSLNAVTCGILKQLSNIGDAKKSNFTLCYDKYPWRTGKSGLTLLGRV